jgi:hypothetical protein
MDGLGRDLDIVLAYVEVLSKVNTEGGFAFISRELDRFNLVRTDDIFIEDDSEDCDSGDQFSDYGGYREDGEDSVRGRDGGEGGDDDMDPDSEREREREAIDGNEDYDSYEEEGLSFDGEDVGDTDSDETDGDDLRGRRQSGRDSNRDSGRERGGERDRAAMLEMVEKERSISGAGRIRRHNSFKARGSNQGLEHTDFKATKKKGRIVGSIGSIDEDENLESEEGTDELNVDGEGKMSREDEPRGRIKSLSPAEKVRVS